ncbi:MAG: hypothetical protein LBG09_03045 [Puniceicoccales bacterium]|jgi:hypothetical protein|nr:hypothetical protein [Puniceicoccales bacterium]
MRFVRKIGEIGAVIAGLLAVSLVEADMALGGNTTDKVDTSAATAGALESTAKKATKTQKTNKGRKRAAQSKKQASKSNASKTLAQANKSSDNKGKERVRLTSYLKFGNGTAYATYSNGQKFRHGPALGRFLKNSGKVSRQLV